MSNASLIIAVNNTLRAHEASNDLFQEDTYMLPQKNTTVFRMYATVSDVYLSAVHARTWISHPNNAVESNEVYAIFSIDIVGERGKLSYKLLKKISGGSV